MLKKTFKFHKWNSKFFPVRDHRWLRLVEQLPDDSFWRVTLEEWSDDRTLLQNNTYWGVIIPAGCEYFGYEEWEMEKEFLRLFAPKVTYIDTDGNVQEGRKTTSAMTVKEMREYFDKIIRWMAIEHGVNIEIDPRLRTSGLEPRVPDEDQTRWANKNERE